MIARFIRVIRTQSSERFIIQAKDGEDSAVLDLHYLSSGNVAGTLVVLDAGSFPDAVVPEILQYVDEVLLPEVSIEHHNVSFTAVRGQIIGDFMPHEEG